MAISVITVTKLFFVAYRSANSPRSIAARRIFCASFEILPLSAPAAEISAETRTSLENKSQRISPYDVLIAAIALASEHSLVTHNNREFERAPNLKLEDWIAP